MSATRVLLVEDDPGYARFLREILLESAEDYEVSAVGTIADAVARLAEAFDIVLLDLGLPDADGTEALTAVASAAPHVAVLVLSSHAELDVALESMRLGAQEYLVKGQAEHVLLPRAIRYAIERRRHRDVLAAAHLEAERANAVKDEFLAMLGHELRNPLAPIVTGLALIRHHGGPQIDHHLSIVERQVHHLTRLVDDLLDVSRIARGKLTLEERDVDLADVIADGIETAEPLIKEKGHTLTVENSSEPLLVRGDRSRLAQVVANLLTNAARYTPAKGKIVVSTRREGEEVVLRVRDSGTGMSPELLGRVFELFVQGERTVDRSAGGLGLGLPIVRNIVTLHGGSVSAHSDGVGKGSELVVRLPGTTPASEPLSTPSTSKPKSAPVSRRVLVVDDNADAAELLNVGLTQFGHVTECADDGQAALEAAERFHPEVVLLDLGLPIIDGYEVARRLRAKFADRPLLLIAVTGYGMESDRQRAKAAGFDAHLVKPVDLESVQRIIEG